MSIHKRLRVIWAALTQDWRQETCADCKTTWWADRRDAGLSAMYCGDCEDRRFNEYALDVEARGLHKGAA